MQNLDEGVFSSPVLNGFWLEQNRAAGFKACRYFNPPDSQTQDTRRARRFMWSRVDDNIPHHPKFVKAGAVASWLWICGNCYANRYLTDGFVPLEILSTLGQIPHVKTYADKLVEVGLWEACDGGFIVHDFHDHNPRASEVKRKREQDKERKRNPDGIQTESRRNPDGIQTESRQFPNVPARAIPSQSHPIPVDLKETLVNVETPVNGKNGTQTHATHALDEAWEQFKAAYPAKRRSSGYMANQHFLAACRKVGFPKLLAALELHKTSEDWQKGMIPGLEKWLEKELWIQEPNSAKKASDEAALAHLHELDRRKAQKQ